MDKVEAIRVLASGGADVNVTDLDGATPLHHAAEKGNILCVGALLDEGAMVNVQTRLRKSTPASLARAGGWDGVNVLLAWASATQVRCKIP